jgi:DNA-binding transcriptional LysR family regulator
VARVLVTRRLPDGGLDPLAGHELVGPKSDDTPYTHDELCAHASACDALVTLLTDRIDAAVLAAKQHRGDWLNPEFVAPEYARVRQMPDPIEMDHADTRLAIAELKKFYMGPLTVGAE